MKKTIVTMLAAAALTLSLSVSAFAATGTVERSVNFRSAPSSNSAVYGLLKAGTSFTLVEKANAYWYKVNANGKVGYVSPSYVQLDASSTTPMPTPTPSPAPTPSPSPTPSPTPSPAPSPSPTPTPSPAPTPSPSPSPTPSPAPSGSKVDQVIADAQALLGQVQSQYGANQAPSKINCSAFTKYVFGKEGVTLRWGTKYQKDAGIYVDGSGLRKGDLVFFRVGSSTQIGHVGIYLGNGQMIHNSPSNKGGVGIVSITSGYWKDRYVTARRVL